LASNSEDLIYSAPFPIIKLDSTGRILEGNDNFHRWLGYNREEIIGAPFRWFLDISDWDHYQDWIQGGGGASADFCLKTKNDSTLAFSFKPQKLEEGQLLIYLVDITTHHREKESLVAAVNQAERSTQVKSEFLANMSHEIRTPLHTINGLTSLLLDTSLNEEQKEYAGQISFAGRVLLDLINDILDFSKIEAGRLELESIPYDLFELLEKSVDMVALQAFRKGLEVGLQFDKKAPHMLLGDPLRLRQVVVNLFNNAVKFTNSGEILVTVSQEPGDSDPPLVRIAVKDTGIGIPQDKQKRLFQAFSQVDDSTTRKFGGTGLGLAISKNLVEMMGGSIGVVSQAGEGAEFYFVIPAKTQEQPNLYDFLPDSFFSGKRVLLVDDNDMVRQILRVYLEEWGCQVIQCPSGLEALELLRRGEETFDIALIDNQMPVMDGWRLASEINGDKATQNIKLIMMNTAGVSEETAKMRMLGWFDGYITKPIKRRQLLETMFKAISEVSDMDSEDTFRPVSEPPPVTTGPPLRCLVAEDHEVNRALFERIISKLGHIPILAEDGQTAYELALSEEPDVVFMDMQMPKMSGIEVTKKLISQGFSPPIVAVTANALPAEREACIAAGMSAFISKPFQREDIQSVLEGIRSSDTREASPLSVDPSQEEKSLGVLEELEEVREGDTYVFDETSAVETFMGDTELVESLAVTFLERVRGQLEILKKAVEDLDFNRIDYEGHSIKGSARNLSFNQLGDLGERLEEKGKATVEQGLEQDLEDLHKALTKASALVDARYGRK